VPGELARHLDGARNADVAGSEGGAVRDQHGASEVGRGVDSAFRSSPPSEPGVETRSPVLKGSDFKVESRGASRRRSSSGAFTTSRSALAPTRGRTAKGRKLSWQHSKLILSWVRENGTLHAIVPLRIAIRGDAGGEPRALADVEVTLTLDYAPRDPARSIPDDDIDHFVGLSSLLHAWPYLRAEVQALTAKLEIAPLVLPDARLGECVGAGQLRDAGVGGAQRGDRGGEGEEGGEGEGGNEAAEAGHEEEVAGHTLRPGYAERRMIPPHPPRHCDRRTPPGGK